MGHLVKTAREPVIAWNQRSAIKSVAAAFLVYARKVGEEPAVTQVCIVCMQQYYIPVFSSSILFRLFVADPRSTHE